MSMGARVVSAAASRSELVARARVLKAKGAKRRRALGGVFKGVLGRGRKSGGDSKVIVILK
jgi:hypothetical protein